MLFERVSNYRSTQPCIICMYRNYSFSWKLLTFWSQLKIVWFCELWSCTAVCTAWLQLNINSAIGVKKIIDLSTTYFTYLFILKCKFYPRIMKKIAHFFNFRFTILNYKIIKISKFYKSWISKIINF